jgi:DOPA 4,5-dioxygenase
MIGWARFRGAPDPENRRKIQLINKSEELSMRKVSGFHAHVYFDPDQRDEAVHLRTQVGNRFRVQLGSVHDVPVGPHPKGMFQIIITNDQFGIVVPWLMLNRRGLDVLVHPETGDDLADHARFAIWMGQALPLQLDAL